MQQILILSLISFLFVSCGSSKNTDDWKAPNIYYLRADGNKSLVLTSGEKFELNDYIYISESQVQNPDIDSIKKKSTEINLSSSVKCIVTGRSFTTKNSYKKSYVQVKEIIPLEAILYPNSLVTCKIQIQIQNSTGSTKTYLLPERSVNPDSFAQDISINETLLESELSSTQIRSLKKGDKISLVCSSIKESIVNPGVTSVTLEQLTSKVKNMVVDIPAHRFQPNQQCRISVLEEEQKILSNTFSISFERLTPKYSFSIYKKRHGKHLFLYDLNLNNPHRVPVAVALRKASLKVPLYDVISGGSKNIDRPDRYHYYTDNAQINTSGDAVKIDKGNVIVIFLQPGESFNLHAYKDSKCQNSTCTRSDVKAKHLPIYNLEYNYRSTQEIIDALEVNILDQVLKN